MATKKKAKMPQKGMHMMPNGVPMKNSDMPMKKKGKKKAY